MRPPLALLALAACAHHEPLMARAVLGDLDDNPIRVHSAICNQRVTIRGEVRGVGMTEPGHHEQTTTRIAFGTLVSDTVAVRGRQRPYVVVDDGVGNGPAIICFGNPGRNEAMAALLRGDRVQIRGRVYEVTARAVLVEKCQVEEALRTMKEEDHP